MSSLLLPFLIIHTAGATAGEVALINTIFKTYDNRIRPSVNGSITQVSTQLGYFILNSMDQEEEYITFLADMELWWWDPTLEWTPSASNDYTSTLYLDETKVWRPDIAVLNTLSQTQIIPAYDRVATVMADGTVWTTNPSVYQTWCDLDVNNFPFDTQDCTIQVGSWVYTTSELIISSGDGYIDVNNSTYPYVGNSEWKVVEITPVVVNQTVVNQGSFQQVNYNIRLKRRATYYVYVLLIPTFIVSTLCILGLFTPLDNFGNRSERATLGLTTLLSLSVILNLVGTDMPKQSTLPRLAVYVLAQIFVCTIGVIITIAIQMAHQRVNTRLLMPPNLKVREQFPHSQPDKMGLRVLVSADGNRERGSAVDHIETSLRNIQEFIDKQCQIEELRVYWVFDKMDIVFLIIMQAANIILTIFALSVKL